MIYNIIISIYNIIIYTSLIYIKQIIIVKHYKIHFKLYINSILKLKDLDLPKEFYYLYMGCINMVVIYKR